MLKKTKKQNNNNQIVLSQLIPNAGIADWYYKELSKMIRVMTKQVFNQVTEVYKGGKEQVEFAQDDAVGSDLRIKMNFLQRKFKFTFSTHSKDISERLIKKNNRQSKTTIEQSLNKIKDDSTKKNLAIKADIISPELKEVMKVSIEENVNLIKSIPEKYFTQVIGSVTRSVQAGGSLAQLEKELMKYQGMTLRRAKFIATDQTRKVYNSINARKMDSLGIKKFKWIHSGGGQHPRAYHKNVLNGNVYELDNPPIIDERTGERGLPAQLPNCKCRMAPVIDFDDL